MQVIEVSTDKTRQEFIAVAAHVYKNDPIWVHPLDTEIEAVFDPSKNNYHTHGNIIRWVLKDEKGQLLGRVAAFINNKKAYLPELPTGGMGFFECVNNKEAAFLLFDACKNWLQQQGMKAMTGPINFGENDKPWGLLVEGFTHPSFGMAYNPPYYRAFFEEYGFVKDYNQITKHIDITVPFTERFAKIADWVLKKPGYRIEPFDKDNPERHIKIIQEVYNDAWKNFENFTAIDIESIREQFNEMKPIMDKNLVLFCYINDEPASFIVCLPDVNQVIKHLNGKLNLWGKLKFLYYKQIGSIDRIRVLVMGSKQKYQNHGLESAMIKYLHDYVIPMKKYKEVELSWVGDFNEKMQAIHKATGAKPGKIHTTYLYTFAD